MNYNKQATDFLKETNTTFKAEFLENGFHFYGDTETRDIYKITLTRGSRAYTFNFGQSINNSGFYYTKGVQKTNLDRKYLKTNNLGNYIKTKIDYSFLNNNKSDIIHYPKVPTEYNVLACLTKCDPESLELFCDMFGYDIDSKKAEIIYNSILEEYHNVVMLWNEEEIELLQEIQ